MRTLTVNDLRCDLCGQFLSGPAAGVRFVFHPGVPELRDDSGMACVACWDALTRTLDLTAASGCAACGDPAPRRQSLHVRRFSQPGSWRLCARHTVSFLNSLRTVTPKLDPAAFRFPGTPESG
ncbi:MAG TPA: hypothetical protein VFO01_11890 [Trebonia sp.]|nr:hypothetical protein [Trebonia sp.]